MYGEILKDIDRIWQISGYGSWGGRGNCNYTVKIIAKTAEEAISKLRENNADVKIVSVNHHGAIYDSK